MWEFNSIEEQEYFADRLTVTLPAMPKPKFTRIQCPTAVSMRHQVFKMVAEGKDKAQIMHYMTERYGDFVLYNPPLTIELPCFGDCLLLL